MEDLKATTVDNAITVLVGCWAVDAYNPWYGSEKSPIYD